MTRIPFTLLAALFAVAPLAAAEITTLSGNAYSGTFVNIAGGMANFRTDAGPLAIPVKELAEVDFGSRHDPLAGVKFDELELVDGSRIRLNALKIVSKSVLPSALSGPAGQRLPEFTVPLESTFYLMRGADDATRRDDWNKLLAGRGRRDLFVIRESSGLTPVGCTILGGSDDGAAIRFEREIDGKQDTYNLARVTGGLVFNQPPRGEIPSTLCKLHDVFGNVLIVHELAMTEAGMQVRTVSGAIVKYAGPEAIARLDFTTGNVAYLSDLEPQVTAPRPAEGEPNWTFLRDRTPDGSGFKLASMAYPRGLWIAPDVSLTFKLNGDYREFKLVAGIDDAVNVADSAARLTVEADGKVIFNELIARKDKPRELTLDVKNVKLLKIGVEGEGLYLGNQVSLAEARLLK